MKQFTCILSFLICSLVLHAQELKTITAHIDTVTYCSYNDDYSISDRYHRSEATTYIIDDDYYDSDPLLIQSIDTTWITPLTFSPNILEDFHLAIPFKPASEE